MLTLRLLGNCTVTQLNYLCKYRAVQQCVTATASTIIMSAPPLSMSTAASSSSSSASSDSRPADDAKRMVTFLEHIGKLKHLKRTGWVIRGVADCETVASHMYRMAMMTYLLDGNNAGDLDRAKCLELALVHDMAESIVGDLTPYCGVAKADKMQRELDAMREITEPLGARGTRLMELFLEYERHETAEARFVKELDRLDMVLQAHEYEKRDA